MVGFFINGGNRDIAYWPARGHERRLFAQTTANETQPALSPDGRWLAYVSDAEGTKVVLVEPFPAGGPKMRASADLPGQQPRWRGGSAVTVLVNWTNAFRNVASN